MKTVGIIAEYNPFHLGHAYQIRYAKEVLKADRVVIAMSGNFVQRGTPALLSKELRTEMALQNGADLVCELPVSVSTASAEFFARGGVQLLNGLGVVDQLCFGSESGEISDMRQAAKILAKEPPLYQAFLKEELSSGTAFPSARSKALCRFITSENADLKSGSDFASLLSSPNNILGIEYCKALIREDSSMEPVTILREGSSYHEDSLEPDQFPSATAIRTMLSQYHGKSFSHYAGELSSCLPESCIQILKRYSDHLTFLSEQDLDLLLRYRLLTETKESLQTYLDLTPELASRILRHRGECISFTQFTKLLKTRDMTYTRVQRALLHLILNIHDVPDKLPYVRVLGFRREAGDLLKQIKANASLPVVTKISAAARTLSPDENMVLQQTTFANNLYETLVTYRSGQAFQHDFQKTLILL